nr:class I SAM-dependent methyltransferase [Massilia frigida]
MLDITRGTGEFLAHVIGAMGAREILEIGTSNGYSTLWLADAVAANDGKVTTVDMAPLKLRMARENIAASGLGRTIEQVEGDAGALVRLLLRPGFPRFPTQRISWLVGRHQARAASARHADRRQSHLACGGDGAFHAGRGRRSGFLHQSRHCRQGRIRGQPGTGHGALLGASKNRSERCKFRQRSAAVRRYGEHRRAKIAPRSRFFAVPYWAGWRES